MTAISHVERLRVGERFAFLTPAGTIRGRVVFVTVDSYDRLSNVEVSMPIIDAAVPQRCGAHLNIPGHSIAAYWKVT